MIWKPGAAGTGRAHWRDSVRVVFRIAPLVLGLALGACVDAPITPDQLEADGTLRLRGGSQAAFAAVDAPQTQQAVRVSAVLAPQSDGPLEDRNVFGADVGTVHLHLRADGLIGNRPVVYRWAHDDLSVLVPGELTAASSMSLGSSFEIEPEQFGHWTVDVLSQPTEMNESPRVLFHREFEVSRPSE